MKNLTITLTLVSTFCMIPVFAQTHLRDTADVTAVHEVTERVNQPFEQCRTEALERRGGAQERSPVGAVIGAVAGGILGHQVGGGSGKMVATGVGVLTGAMVGDNLGNRESDRPSREEVRRCELVDNWVSHVTGYEVSYRYADMDFKTIMPHRPGRTLNVEVSVTPVN